MKGSQATSGNQDESSSIFSESIWTKLTISPWLNSLFVADESLRLLLNINALTESDAIMPNQDWYQFAYCITI